MAATQTTTQASLDSSVARAADSYSVGRRFDSFSGHARERLTFGVGSQRPQGSPSPGSWTAPEHNFMWL